MSKRLTPRDHPQRVNGLVNHQPAIDLGWRTSLFPPGTVYSTALAAVTAAQSSVGNTVDPSTATLVAALRLPTTADYLPDGQDHNRDDHGRRNVVPMLGTVGLRYRISGPGIHTS